MRAFLTDLVFAARRLRRAPGVVFLSLLSISLGIGMITAVATTIRTLTSQALPFRSPERLYLLFTADRHDRQGGYSYQELQSLGRHVRTLDLAGFDRRFFDAGEQGSVQGAAVTPNFFDVLGQTMALGTSFSAEKEGGGAGSAVLSYDYWQTAFGGDPSVVGRVVHLDGRPYTVRGVVSPGLPFPRRARIWTVLDVSAPDRGSDLGVVGRLRSGQTPSQARVEVQQANSAILAERPPDSSRVTGRLLGLGEDILGRRRAAMRLLQMAGWLVFLIASLNVSGLLLARHASREGELAMRLSLGAGWWHIGRLLVCEGLLLTIGGVVAGSLLAMSCVPSLLRWSAGTMGITPAPQPFASIVAFALAMAILGAFLVSVPPFARAIFVAPAAVLSRHSTRVSRRSRLGRSLVGVQMALVVILLVPAAALTRSVRNLETVTPGFAARNALVVRISLPENRYAENDVPSAFQQILDGVRNQPGIQAAGMVHILPLTGWNPGATLSLDDVADQEQQVDIQRVSAGYFEAMGIPVRGGVLFRDSDVGPSPHVAVVNEAFVRRFSRDRNVLGRRLRLGSGRDQTDWLTVTGVIGDVRQFGLNQEPRAEVYVPSWIRAMSMVVRSDHPADAANRLRTTLPSLNLTLRGADVRSLDDIVRDSTLPAKAMAFICALLGAVALILGGVGVYGMTAQSVEQRSLEIGIRRALGASHRAIVRLILGDLAIPLIAAAVGGLAIGSAAAGTLRSLLYQVAPYDVRNGVLATLVLAGMVVVSALFPLRSALRVDPAQVLHTE
jgi:putative ABC transport system permease protein